MNIEPQHAGRTLHALLIAPQDAVIATTSDDHAKRLRYLAHKLDRDDITVHTFGTDQDKEIAHLA